MSGNRRTPAWLLAIVGIGTSQLFPASCLALEESTTAQAKVLPLPTQSASDKTSPDALEELTRKIARKETELLRLSTAFRLEATRTGPMKPWRLFLYNLAASGVSTAGASHICASRWHYWTTPAKMSRSTAATGPTCLLIGHSISLFGVLTEEVTDRLYARKVKEKGLDLKSTKERVFSLKNEIDDLIDQREKLLNSTDQQNDSEMELACAEGPVLKDIRDLALDEYCRFFTRANRFFANRETNALMSTVAIATGGFQGSLLGIISARQRRPPLVGPGGIGFMVSGAAIAATPHAARLAEELKGRQANSLIRQELGLQSAKEPPVLAADLNKLTSLLAAAEVATPGGQTNLTRRLQGYNQQRRLFEAQDQFNREEKAFADRELFERGLFAAAIGGSKISWGVNQSIAGFGFQRKMSLQPLSMTNNGTNSIGFRVVSSPQPSKLFTRGIAIAATTYAPGMCLWLIDTAQNRWRGRQRERRLAVKKSVTATLLKERMDMVQEIDDVFNY